MKPDFVLSPSINETDFHKVVNTILVCKALAMPKTNSLITDHEADVLRLVCKEYNNEEIADALSRSKRTIEGTRTRIMKKLGVKSSIGMVKYAVRVGIYSVI